MMAQERSFVTGEKDDDDLMLFLQMRNNQENTDNNHNLLPHNSTMELRDSYKFVSKSESFLESKSSPITPVYDSSVNDFLNSEADNNTSDYDWLLAPPGVSLFPLLEAKSQITAVTQIQTSDAQPTDSVPGPENLLAEIDIGGKSMSKQPGLSTGNPSNVGTSRRSLSCKRSSTVSGAPTPTGQPTLSAPTKPSRSSTPTSRSTFPSSNSKAAPLRSSTPTRSTARFSMPTARSGVSKSTSRSATPSHSTPSIVPSTFAPASQSSVTKSGNTSSKNLATSRGTSPTVRSRPLRPSQMPGFSQDASPNLRISMPQRPSSTSRGRPSVPSAKSSSGETGSNGRQRQKSCSPFKGRAPNGTAYINGRSSSATKCRGQSNGIDDVNPVLIGSKMVERVVNMRKLVPPSQHDHNCNGNNHTGSSQDSSGFGRTLSKTSLDMALRHMDIRRSIPGSLRAPVRKFPASSYKSRTGNISDSPLATSSNSSFEVSDNNNSLSLNGSEDNDLDSERENSSLNSHQND